VVLRGEGLGLSPASFDSELNRLYFDQFVEPQIIAFEINGGAETVGDAVVGEGDDFSLAFLQSGRVLVDLGFVLFLLVAFDHHVFFDFAGGQVFLYEFEDN
jgi:hypothetical protein